MVKLTHETDIDETETVIDNLREVKCLVTKVQEKLQEIHSRGKIHLKV